MLGENREGKYNTRLLQENENNKTTTTGLACESQSVAEKAVGSIPRKNHVKHVKHVL